MTHPFAYKTELDPNQTDQVAGGNTIEGRPVLLPSDSELREQRRPDIGSTMAIGEEGGFRFPIM